MKDSHSRLLPNLFKSCFFTEKPWCLSMSKHNASFFLKFSSEGGAANYRNGASLMLCRAHSLKNESDETMQRIPNVHKKPNAVFFVHVVRLCVARENGGGGGKNAHSNTRAWTYHVPYLYRFDARGLKGQLFFLHLVVYGALTRTISVEMVLFLLATYVVPSGSSMINCRVW